MKRSLSLGGGRSHFIRTLSALSVSQCDHSKYVYYKLFPTSPEMLYILRSRKEGREEGEGGDLCE